MEGRSIPPLPTFFTAPAPSQIHKGDTQSAHSSPSARAPYICNRHHPTHHSPHRDHPNPLSPPPHPLLRRRTGSYPFAKYPRKVNKTFIYFNLYILFRQESFLTSVVVRVSLPLLSTSVDVVKRPTTFPSKGNPQWFTGSNPVIDT